MTPQIANLAFYLVLLPLVAAVGSIALGIMARAVVEPWARRVRNPAPIRAARARRGARTPAREAGPAGPETAPAARAPGPA
ncbi:hypothetical protein [Roseomonas populi]|uniref:Cellulose biosynthesis protein BcsF n=1 Tax=Roseomonas populi TaxID=3121582 RepID=A0ABT1X7T5_9PROT|nr:hypothetical protein [Roseomonas pecuniae]MCR0984176.1 hypothetical protein [Roseomonas pecuniae]